MTSVLAVIVVYETDISVSPTFLSLIFAQKKINRNRLSFKLAIYDNSPQKRELPSTNGEVEIIHIHDVSNPGVGKAYNTFAKIAEELSIQWLLLLDQDTQLPQNLFDVFYQSITLNPSIKILVPILKLESGTIFSPCRYRFKRGFPLKKIEPGIHTFESLSPVNSGMFVDVKAFLNCGGYKENIPLDFSDFQFIERFKKTQQYFYVMDIVACQDFSNDEVDIKKLANRFVFFCIGALNSERENLIDDFKFFIVVFVRSLMLFKRTLSFRFFQIFFQKYILKRT